MKMENEQLNLTLKSELPLVIEFNTNSSKASNSQPAPNRFSETNGKANNLDTLTGRQNPAYP